MTGINSYSKTLLILIKYIYQHDCVEQKESLPHFLLSTFINIYETFLLTPNIIIYHYEKINDWR